jgi:hypothetical protein
MCGACSVSSRLSSAGITSDGMPPVVARAALITCPYAATSLAVVTLRRSTPGRGPRTASSPGPALRRHHRVLYTHS